MSNSTVTAPATIRTMIVCLPAGLPTQVLASTRQLDRHLAVSGAVGRVSLAGVDEVAAGQRSGRGLGPQAGGAGAGDGEVAVELAGAGEHLCG